jgi:hypothetical protein
MTPSIRTLNIDTADQYVQACELHTMVPPESCPDWNADRDWRLASSKHCDAIW